MRLTTRQSERAQLGDPDVATDQLLIEISDFDAVRAFGGRRSVRQLMNLPCTEKRQTRRLLRETTPYDRQTTISSNDCDATSGHVVRDGTAPRG
ncbi:hypothetical protein ABQF35_10980 [Mycobacterium syngnathidarum]